MHNRNQNIRDVVGLFMRERARIRTILKYLIAQHGSVVVSFTASGRYVHENSPDVYSDTHIKGGFAIRLEDNDENLNVALKEILSNLKYNKSNFQGSSSCISKVDIICFDMQVHKFNAPFHGCYDVNLIPKEIRGSYALMDVKHEPEKENYCFLNCILANRFTGQSEMRKLNLTSIKFPTSMNDVHQFCKQNRDYSVDIYQFDATGMKKEKIQLIRKTEKQKKHHTNLLSIKRDDNHFHFLLITRLDMFLTKFYNKHGHGVMFCKKCNLAFPAQVRKELIDLKMKKKEQEERQNRRDLVESEGSDEGYEDESESDESVGTIKINKMFYCRRCTTPASHVDVDTPVFCHRCLIQFRNKIELVSLNNRCLGRPFNLPKKGNNYLYFKNYKSMIRSKFTISADFESFLVPPSKNEFSLTGGGETLHVHRPFSYGYLIDVDEESVAFERDPQLRKERIYTANDYENVCISFLKSLIKDVSMKII